jgi:hypothetical protein
VPNGLAGVALRCAGAAPARGPRPHRGVLQ